MVRALLTACGEHSQSLAPCKFYWRRQYHSEEPMTKGVCPLPVPTHTGRCVWTGWGDHVLARRVFAQAGVPRSAADRCIIDLSRFACRRQARRYTNFDEGAKFSCNPDQISLRKCV
jgi:hypothetical protein